MNSLRLSLSILALAAAASAQVGVNYSFAQATGAYTPITGGTLLGTASTANSMDDAVYSVTLPFSFVFDGAAQTSVYMSTNGFLTFGATSPGTTNYAPISSTTAYAGAVAAFGRDLQGGYVTTADTTASNNVLTNVSSVGPLQVGDTVVGGTIPTGTTVTAIVGNTITLSAAPTGTATNITLTGYGPWSEMRYETLGTAPNQIFVAQWQGWKRFGSTLTTVKDMTLNFQIRLHEATGTVEVAYGNCSPGTGVTYATVSQVGLRGPTNAFPTNINNRLNVKGTSDWATSTAGTANSSGEVFNTAAPANVIPNGLTYLWTLPTGVPATTQVYGTGCYKRSATAYELFGTFDLAGGAAMLLPNGNGGYTAIPSAPTAFVHTVPGLALTDDSIGTLTLPTAFTYPGGSTTALDICSNGYIWMQSPNTLADFSPSAAELFSNPARFCPLWCDLLPDGATNLNNVYAEVDAPNNKAYVTWSNVPTFTAGGTVNMQVEFDLVTNAINVTWGAITLPAITSLVGWTPGTGFSTVDAGSMDLSSSLPFSTSAAESLPLSMTASANPVLGTNVTYTTSNIPAAAILSAHFISLIQVNPGVDLGFMGAPGCFQYVDLNLGASTLLFGSPTATATIGVPNNPAMVGLPLSNQAASLVPGVNALGAITSNGVKSTLGNF